MTVHNTGTPPQANTRILSRTLAETLNIPDRVAIRTLDAVLDSISVELRRRGRVAVKGFGTFERRVRKGRAYKHPLTGEVIDVPNRETITFLPSDQLVLDTCNRSAEKDVKS